MLYQEYPPSHALSDAVASYWRFALEASDEPAIVDHRVPPDGLVGLCWLPSGRAVIVGPRVTALPVPVQRGLVYELSHSPRGPPRAYERALLEAAEYTAFDALLQHAIVSGLCSVSAWTSGRRGTRYPRTNHGACETSV